MPKLIDLTGRRFGRWTVLRRAEHNKGHMPAWVCKCDCGTEATVQGGNLRDGNSNSCGCAHAKHGFARAKQQASEYLCWRNMRQRCLNPTWPSYKHYGGRGITICPEWRDSFEAFIADMGLKPSPELTLERVDNDAGYEPGNCIWATRSQQNRNRRYLGRRPRHEEAARHA